MKRIVLLALMVLSAVGCYDDAALWDQIMDHESRLVKLEALCNQMNTNIQSLQAIVTALQNNDYVTNVAPVKENGKDIGYTISFSKSGSVTIYHGADGKDGSNGKDGADGKDGHTPVIGIRQDSDGVWYWTLDGDWLMNDAGAKIPTTGADGKDGVNGTDGKDGADGKDGVTPLLKIEEGYWYISYDNGLSWVKLDKAVGEDGKDGTDGVDGKDGDSFFKSVTQDDDSVYLTLSDGTEFVLPKSGRMLKITLAEERVFCGPDKSGEVIMVDYVLQYNPADGPAKISTISEGVCKSEVLDMHTDTENGIAEGKVIISTNASSGKVTVFAQDQGGHLTMETIEVCVRINLSEYESANCYIVSKVGGYIFDARKGNRPFSSAEDIASVEVLWETFGTDVVPKEGDLVKNVYYADGAIFFETPDIFKEGNAVIAAKGASGTILWSWHIWLTDQPEGQEYYNNAGTMMDRNLGATSATPGDVGALGLLYQWGRKDPFLGSYSISTSGIARSNPLDWPKPINSNSSTGTIAYATANPTTFIAGEDWCYNGSASSTDNTRWTTSETTKSMYDPCPAGWRVPDGGDNGVWAKALGSSSNCSGYPYDSNNRGMNFSGKFGSSSTIWYPVTGHRLNTFYVHLEGVGSEGKYWSASPDGNNAYYLYCGHGYVEQLRKAKRAYAYSVRCIQESSPSSIPSNEAIDLSKEGTANSYIVSEGGAYKFTPAKGNSVESIGAIASAEVLWETFGTDVTPNVGDLVKAVKYENGVIIFNTPDTFKEGNAVIAAKDASGTILWSWHIWLTDQPEAQVYYNNAGTMMDRNLGATSATAGDVGALGLLYQWGRKDPFLSSSSISESIEAQSTITWPSSVSSDSSNGTIAYATSHPTTFITCMEGHRDWYYTGDGTVDNTRWTIPTRAKSIYDPCPAGWRVPDGGDYCVWSLASGSSRATDYPYDSTNEGMNFSGKFGSAIAIWYPASGYRFDHDGSLRNVGKIGYYWSASPFIQSNYGSVHYMGFGESGSLYDMSGGRNRPVGQSVRCLKE